MPEKLPVVSGQEVVKALVRLGFEVRLGKGSHVVLQKGMRIFAVPLHKELKKGTLRKILRQAEVSIREFNSVL